MGPGPDKGKHCRGPMSLYTDRQWHSRDGLALHYRDYPGSAERVPVLCLPGLTRNARDFEDLAAHLCGAGWRVLCPDLRGRGDSDYAKDSATYNPLQYAEDIGELLAQAGIGRFVSIGTSLGGLVTMILAMQDGGRIAGAVLNDVGPEVDPAGIERIRGYVGKGGSFPTWMHAARALMESGQATYPDFDITRWLTIAKRCMTLGGNGRVVFDYDMKIAEPFATPDGPVGADLWPALDALAGRPVLLLRGGTSDILSAATLEKMARRLPDAATLTLPGIGHAPTLDEPAAVAAIDALLAKVR